MKTLSLPLLFVLVTVVSIDKSHGFTTTGDNLHNRVNSRSRATIVLPSARTAAKTSISLLFNNNYDNTLSGQSKAATNTLRYKQQQRCSSVLRAASVSSSSPLPPSTSPSATAFRNTTTTISEFFTNGVSSSSSSTTTNGATAKAAAAAAETNEIACPSYKTLIQFCLTTVLIWLTEPLLSLVDTTVVGWSGASVAAAAATVVGGASSTVLQLAALGPATTLYDSWLYLTYFLSMATTNKLTSARAKGDYKVCLQTVSHVLGVAVVLGLITTATMWAGASTFLTRMVASNKGAAALIPLSSAYVRIRASVAVASIMGMVSQSICLSVLDTKTPIYAVMAASIINLVGDLSLRHYGIQGVALATALSSVASCSVLLRAVYKQTRQWRQLLKDEQKQKELDEEEQQQQQLILQQQQQQPDAQNNQLNGATPINIETANVMEMSTAASEAEDSFVPFMNSQTTNGEATSATNEVSTAAEVKTVDAVSSSSSSPKKKSFNIPFISLPNQKSFIELVKLSGPIFFVILAKISCYSAVTLRTTQFGVVTLAAHNIMMRIFFFFGTFGDALSQTAQSFLPDALYPKVNKKTLRQLLQKLGLITFVIALVNSQLSLWLLHNCGPLLTKDVSIVQGMRGLHTQFLGLSMLVHPFSLLLEGTVLSLKNFKTLVMTYMGTVCLHFTVLNLYCNSFGAVWRTFFLFQFIRLMNFTVQLLRSRQQSKKAEFLRQQQQMEAQAQHLVPSTL